MVAKIFKSSNDKNFGAVMYNEGKIDKGKGELIDSKNFPNYIDINDKELVKSYFKQIANCNNNSAFKSPQFHAVISCKNREADKEVLKDLCNEYMKNLGYEKQPYLLIYHNDTKNNHVHIVSTNVDIDNYKSLDLKFQKIQSVKALQKAEKEVLGIDYVSDWKNLLKYNFSNTSQLEKLLVRNGFDFFKKDNELFIKKGGVTIDSIKVEELKFKVEDNENRRKQIYNILNKYKDEINNDVFAVLDKNNNVKEWKSKFQDEMKSKFGLDILFSTSENKVPFGYSIIDNKTKEIFKGSDVVNMKNLFNFTEVKITDKFFEILENSLLKDDDSKSAMKLFFEKQYDYKVDDLLLNFGKKIDYDVYKECRDIVKGYSNNYIKNSIEFNENFSTIKVNENHFVFSEKYKLLIPVSELLKNKEEELNFNKNINEDKNVSEKNSLKNKEENSNIETTQKEGEGMIDGVLNALNSINFGSGEDEEVNNRKKKRKR